MRPFVDVTSRVEDPFLRHALSLALRARGATAPNPMVGCVVVAGGRIAGEGYHPRAGEAHAEVFALADAGEAARDSHVYVTLEPCSHHGRTPPCTDALIAAGVASVTIGMQDPSPDAGGGADALRAAGIEVTFADDSSPFAELNRGWLKRIASGLPWVTAKVGLSLDARIALGPGERTSITGPAGAGVTRELRRRADAVMVGAATVIADDPSLTVRDADGVPAEHQPIRVVLCGDRMPSADSKVLSDEAAPTLLLVPDTLRGPSNLPPGVQAVRFSASDGLVSALKALAAHGVNDVLVEPGQKLLTALWHDSLVDELVTVTAGGMAGEGALSLYDGPEDSVDGESLLRLFCPVEAGIVEDVSVTIWRPSNGVDAL